MKKIEINLYEVNELSEEARKHAFYSWSETAEFPYILESENILKKFCDLFSVKVYDYNFQLYRNINFEIEKDEEIQELKGVRLLKYLQNNFCEYLYENKKYTKNGKAKKSKIFLEKSDLTGYYLDYYILEPIYSFLSKPSDLNFYELIKKCLYNWLDALDGDYELYYSLDNFIEEMEVNKVLFLKNGEVFSI